MSRRGKSHTRALKIIREDMSVAKFIDKFCCEFSDYSEHKIEAWYLNTVKNASFTPTSQPPNTMTMISDFAQNLQLSSKKETSEEYFHKPQVALFGTVSTINVPVSEGSIKQRTISQVLSSVLMEKFDQFY